MPIYRILIGFCFFAFSLFASATIESANYYLPYGKQKIHVKEKKISHEKLSVVILINPLSIPSLEAFDVPGYSLMDTLAKAGFDVWAIDFIGEGCSSYPESMKKNPAPIGPLPLRAKQAIPQLNTLVNFIQKKTSASNVALLGWSWGSVVAGMYAIQYPEKVNHVILYGGVYGFSLPAQYKKMFLHSSPMSAYQNVPWKVVAAHWEFMRNHDESIVTKKSLHAVEKTYSHIDPQPFIPNTIRRPMGPMADLLSIWNDRPIYDIHELTKPTLVIYGDQDVFADPYLFSKLTQVKIKKEVKLPHATHWLIYEKSRTAFSNEVINFLKK